MWRSYSAKRTPSIGAIFKRSAARARIKNIDEVAGHSTRSGAISQSIASGVDPHVVRRQSGHKADSGVLSGMSALAKFPRALRRPSWACS